MKHCIKTETFRVKKVRSYHIRRKNKRIYGMKKIKFLLLLYILIKL